tara:strand:- start:2626 stop:2868 length:243 start_codon:yes stop_codon:yes gene_type:complete
MLNIAMMISIVAISNNTTRAVSKRVKIMHTRNGNQRQQMRALSSLDSQLLEAIFFVNKSDMDIPVHLNRGEVESILPAKT